MKGGGNLIIGAAFYIDGGGGRPPPNAMVDPPLYRTSCILAKILAKTEMSNNYLLSAGTSGWRIINGHEALSIR